MATIFVDDQTYNVRDGQNLLQACLSLGLNLPYFCWHPALGSVGACRQCAVKQFRDEKDTRGRLVMACMTPAAEGTRIAVEDAEAREFRASVTEWLMMSHPHDCPVCDEGGECHLQDMTVMTGHVYRRFNGKKRTFRNQYLGPLLNHEMNRCIQCYRCVRFYRDYAGGRDFDAFVLRDRVFFGRHEDGILQNEFSGNLVEVCPTGVFTDKSLKRHYTRKWDLQSAPSVCVHCSLGCNTIPSERYNQLRRVRNRYNGQVNGYFLCDRGRYGYEFVNSRDRIRQPMIRKPGNQQPEPAGREETLQYLGNLLRDGVKVIGIGSPRASLEANFALCRLVGPERFFLGTSENDAHLVAAAIDTLRNGPAPAPSLREVEKADAAFVLGEDPTETAPMLALALRQAARRKQMKIAQKLQIPEWNDAAVRGAVQQAKGALFIAAPYATRLDDVAIKTHRGAPQELARLAFAVSQIIRSGESRVGDLPGSERLLAQEIAAGLEEAERPVIVSGTGCASEAVIRAAANVAWALVEKSRKAELCFALPECNSMGLGLMGGGSLKGALEAVRSGAVEVVIILENDLYRRIDAASVETLLGAAAQVIVLDHLLHRTALKAHVVLPAASFAEGDGTLVNNEGRAQRFYQVFCPRGETQESWRWVRDMMIAAGQAQESVWQNLDDITSDLARSLPVFHSIGAVAPPAGFRVFGAKIPRQPHRYSGRTAMVADRAVHEPKPPSDPDSALSFSMEGYQGEPPSALVSRFWAPGWNSVQSVNKFQSEIGGPLHGGDPGLRLIEPARVEKIAYFAEAPAAFKARSHQWLIIPIYHTFGSEELSALAPGIAELAPEPYVGLNPEEADRLQAHEREELEVLFEGTALRLPLKLVRTLPTGLAVLPVGLRGLAAVPLPAWCGLALVREKKTAVRE